MFVRHTLSAVAIGIIVWEVSIAKADLALTINGLNPASSPLTIQEIIPLLVTVDGNTPVGPNDISVAVTGGSLEPIPDTNNAYYFEFAANESAAMVSMTTNTDLIIDGNLIPTDTTIYELYLFYDQDANVISAIGISASDLSVSEEPDEEQVPSFNSAQSTITDMPMTPVAVEANVSESPVQADYNLPMRAVTGWEKYRVFVNGPNSIDVGMATRFLQEEPVPMSQDMISDEGDGYGILGIPPDLIYVGPGTISTNQVWRDGYRYRICGLVYVEALLVIEPGTIVEYESGSSYIVVQNGGTLVSAGTPAQPIIYMRDYHEEEYPIAIRISSTASPQTKITYSYFTGANTAIAVLNIRLESPIENNIFYNNRNGIFERNNGNGSTDIINNLFYQTQDTAIYVILWSGSYWLQLPQPDIIIQNNTIDSQSIGISIEGYPDCNLAGWAVIANNVITRSSGCGIYPWNYNYLTVVNNGYYGNTVDSWAGEYGECNPVYEANMPFVEGADGEFYLRQDCNFINAGFEYVEQTRVIGKTTDVTGLPDIGIVDLGYHYSNWDYSNAGDGNMLSGDLNQDGIVNFIDFAILANDWPITRDIFDLSMMADDWLKTSSSHPPIAVNVFGDLNNLTGNVDIGISGRSYGTTEGFICIDGELKGYTRYSEDPEMASEYAAIDTMKFENGHHDIKAVTIDSNGLVTASPTISVDFNNAVYCITMNDDFEPNKDYRISAMSDLPTASRAKFVGWDGNTAWVSSPSVGGLNVTVPPYVLTGAFYNVIALLKTLCGTPDYHQVVR